MNNTKISNLPIKQWNEKQMEDTEIRVKAEGAKYA